MRCTGFHWCVKKRIANRLQILTSMVISQYTYVVFLCFSESKWSRWRCLPRSWSSRKRQEDGFCLSVSWLHFGPMCTLSLRATSNTQRDHNHPHRPGMYCRSYFHDQNGGSYGCLSGWKTGSRNDIAGGIFPAGMTSSSQLMVPKNIKSKNNKSCAGISFK